MMYRNFFSIALAATLGIATFACGNDQPPAEEQSGGINISIEDENGQTRDVNINLDEKDIQGVQNTIADALEQASQSLREGGSEPVEVKGYQELKALLPETLLGMERTTHKGEKTSAFGFKVSQAEAAYKGGDDRSLNVTFMDTGNTGLAKLSLAAWTTMDIDREGDDGYERTTTIDGFKALETWEAATGDASLIYFYQNRYLITLKGSGVDGDDLRRALKKVDYDSL
ncbi:MAG: hypothetical protein R2795_26765 [Saprospiraceae bacterium]